MDFKKQRLAIIGTGIAGMGSAHLLQHSYDIELFEKNNYVGGHTNTVYVEEDGQQIPIDTGFMVFNKQTYPNLINLFNQLKVPIKKTSMSFSVQHKSSQLEYCGSGFSGLFAQRKNIFNTQFIKMLLEINRFNKESLQDLVNGNLEDLTIQEYIQQKKLGKEFTDKYLIPMSSAIWSTPPDVSLKFPIKGLVHFFRNHGMLGVDSHFQWYTVEGGSESYKQLLIEPFRDKIHLNSAIKEILTVEEQVKITTNAGKEHWFDKVIVAAHADEALSMLANPNKLQKKLLSQFCYQKNRAVLHSDCSVMPKNKKVWSSWNYLMDDRSGNIKTSTIYNMNSLQNVSQKQSYFVSINPIELKLKKIHQSIPYDHPIFTVEAMKAQERLPELNHEGPIYFCGSYFKYGFHEDAYSSAVELAKTILKTEHQKKIQQKAE